MSAYYRVVVYNDAGVTVFDYEVPVEDIRSVREDYPINAGRADDVDIALYLCDPMIALDEIEDVAR